MADRCTWIRSVLSLCKFWKMWLHSTIIKYFEFVLGQYLMILILYNDSLKVN